MRSFKMLYSDSFTRLFIQIVCCEIIYTYDFTTRLSMQMSLQQDDLQMFLPQDDFVTIRGLHPENVKHFTKFTCPECHTLYQTYMSRMSNHLPNLLGKNVKPSTKLVSPLADSLIQNILEYHLQQSLNSE